MSHYLGTIVSYVLLIFSKAPPPPQKNTLNIYFKYDNLSELI